MIEDLVKQIEARFAELGAQMTDPDVISDRERYAEVGRAYSQLEAVAKLAEQWRHARDDMVIRLEPRCEATPTFRAQGTRQLSKTHEGCHLVAVAPH